MPGIFDELIAKLKPEWDALVAGKDWVVKGRPDDAPFSYSETRVGRTPVITQRRPEMTGRGSGGEWQQSVAPMEALRQAINKQGPISNEQAALYLQLGKVLRENPQYKSPGSIVVNVSPETYVSQQGTWGPVMRHEDIHSIASKAPVPILSPQAEMSMRDILDSMNKSLNSLYPANMPSRAVSGEALAYTAQGMTPGYIAEEARHALPPDVRSKVERLSAALPYYEKVVLGPALEEYQPWEKLSSSR